MHVLQLMQGGHRYRCTFRSSTEDDSSIEGQLHPLSPYNLLHFCDHDPCDEFPYLN